MHLCLGGLGANNTVRPQVTAGSWRSCQAGTDTGETVGLQVGTGGTGRSKPATGETVGPGGWLLGRPCKVYVGYQMWHLLTHMTLGASFLRWLPRDGLYVTVLNFQQATSPSWGSFGHGEQPLALKNQQCSPLPSQLGEAQLGKPSNPSSSTCKKLPSLQSGPSPSEQQQRRLQTPAFPWGWLKLHLLKLNPQRLKRSMSRAELFVIWTCGQALLPCSFQGHHLPIWGR